MTRVAIALLYVFDRLKHAYPDRIVLRSAFSGVADLAFDSIIFMSIAFRTAVFPCVP